MRPLKIGEEQHNIIPKKGGKGLEEQDAHPNLDCDQNLEEEDDDDDMIDNRNNVITQAELFRSYSEQNILYVNQSAQSFWFEFGGSRIGRMNIDAMLHAQLKQQ